jgi:hypothetical protein
MATKIYITPPGGAETELVIYGSCNVSMSVTDKAGSVSINSSSKIDTFFDTFTVGADIKVVQDDNVSRWWILNPPRRIEGNLNYIEIQGVSYAARTQKIIVNESYVAQTISTIVKDLFTKYASIYNQDSIVDCDKVITITFADAFLFDAMEQLATLAGYEWHIDEPLPEPIPILSLPAGWAESVIKTVHVCPLPSDTLYPADDLYPC